MEVGCRGSGTVRWEVGVGEPGSDGGREWV